jgi:hypothetical protein
MDEGRLPGVELTKSDKDPTFDLEGRLGVGKPKQFNPVRNAKC